MWTVFSLTSVIGSSLLLLFTMDGMDSLVRRYPVTCFIIRCSACIGSGSESEIVTWLDDDII